LTEPFKPDESNTKELGYVTSICILPPDKEDKRMGHSDLQILLGHSLGSILIYRVRANVYSYKASRLRVPIDISDFVEYPGYPITQLSCARSYNIETKGDSTTKQRKIINPSLDSTATIIDTKLIPPTTTLYDEELQLSAVFQSKDTSFELNVWEVTSTGIHQMLSLTMGQKACIDSLMQQDTLESLDLGLESYLFNMPQKIADVMLKSNSDDDAFKGKKRERDDQETPIRAKRQKDKQHVIPTVIPHSSDEDEAAERESGSTINTSTMESSTMSSLSSLEQDEEMIQIDQSGRRILGEITTEVSVQVDMNMQEITQDQVEEELVTETSISFNRSERLRQYTNEEQWDEMDKENIPPALDTAFELSDDESMQVGMDEQTQAEPEGTEQVNLETEDNQSENTQQEGIRSENVEPENICQENIEPKDIYQEDIELKEAESKGTGSENALSEYVDSENADLSGDQQETIGLKDVKEDVLQENSQEEDVQQETVLTEDNETEELQNDNVESREIANESIMATISNQPQDIDTELEAPIPTEVIESDPAYAKNDIYVEPVESEYTEASIYDDTPDYIDDAPDYIGDDFIADNAPEYIDDDLYNTVIVDQEADKNELAPAVDDEIHHIDEGNIEEAGYDVQDYDSDGVIGGDDDGIEESEPEQLLQEPVLTEEDYNEDQEDTFLEGQQDNTLVETTPQYEINIPHDHDEQDPLMEKELLDLGEVPFVSGGHLQEEQEKTKANEQQNTKEDEPTPSTVDYIPVSDNALLRSFPFLADIFGNHSGRDGTPALSVDAPIASFTDTTASPSPASTQSVEEPFVAVNTISDEDRKAQLIKNIVQECFGTFEIDIDTLSLEKINKMGDYCWQQKEPQPKLFMMQYCQQHNMKQATVFLGRCLLLSLDIMTTDEIKECKSILKKCIFQVHPAVREGAIINPFDASSQAKILSEKHRYSKQEPRLVNKDYMNTVYKSYYDFGH
ncbi:hypothetical protein CU098_011224, partial [Rhizopus stolonifer]